MISDVKNDLNLIINKSTDNLENKSNEMINNIDSKIREINKSARNFWDFETFEIITFWTAIISMAFFVLNEALKVYGVIIPKMVLQIGYPLFFAPILIFLLIQIGKILGVVFELIADKIRY